MSAAKRVCVVAGPWPERIGCVGVIVPPPNERGSYPWAGNPASHAVVLLDDDPLGCAKRGCDHLSSIFSCNYHPTWTFVTDAADIGGMLATEAGA